MIQFLSVSSCRCPRELRQCRPYSEMAFEIKGQSTLPDITKSNVFNRAYTLFDCCIAASLVRLLWSFDVSPPIDPKNSEESWGSTITKWFDVVSV